MELLYTTIHHYGETMITAINAHIESGQAVPMDWYQARDSFLQDRFVLEKVMENKYIPGKHENIFSQYNPCSRPATHIKQIGRATWSMMETDSNYNHNLDIQTIVNQNHTLRMLQMMKLVSTKGFRKGLPIEELVNHTKEEIPTLNYCTGIEEYFTMFTDLKNGRFLANSLIGLYGVRQGWMTREFAAAGIKGL